MSVAHIVRLRAPDRGNGEDKAALYEVEIVDLGGRPEPRHLVNIRRGRKDGALVETTRTAEPVTLEAARRIVDSIVVARLNDGYRVISGAAPAFASPVAAAPERRLDLKSALDEVAAGRLAGPVREKLLFRVGLIADPALGDGALAVYAATGAREATASLVHALARCGRERAAAALEEIGRLATTEAVRDLARYARGSRWMGDRVRPDSDDAPPPERAPDLAALEAEEARAPGSASAALIALGRRGSLDAAARARLLELLSQAQPRPPFLRAFRRLFKFAELGDDAELFAAAARGFELEQPMYRRRNLSRGALRWRGARKPIDARAEAAAPSPRFALSDQTSFYLRRRVWRALRKRGELSQASFVELAGALAARFGESDLPASAGAFVRVRRVWSLAHILYGRHENVRFDVARLTVGGLSARDGFAPPFGDLWTRDVAATLGFALAAQAAPLRAFAADRLAQIEPARLATHGLILADLAASPEPALAAVAEKALEPLVVAPDASAALLARLLDTSHERLRRLTLLAVAARPGAPWAEPALGVAALLAQQPETVARVEAWLAQTPDANALARLAEDFLALLDAEPAQTPPERRARLEGGAERLLRLADGRSLGVSAALFERLAEHPSPATRAAAMRLLAASGLRLDDLSDAFWTQASGAEDAGLRAAALALMASLSDAALMRRGQEIRAAAFDPDHAPRAAVRPVAARLAKLAPDFGGALFGAILPHLFQSEAYEGLAADLAALIDQALKAPREAMPAGQLWRLLTAQAQGARLVGADALAARPDEALPVRRWARLASHPFISVRARALAVFDRRQDWFRADPVAAVGLLDTRWDETRAAVLERLQRWEPSVFSVEALADLADSHDPGAQADARALLRRALEPGRGGPTLARLFEHPAPGFHLFVTELLSNESLESPAAFQRFLEAARMILFRVAAGRAAKTRIWARLTREATSSRQRAADALPILAQMSLSATERDRAPAIALLRDLAIAFPDLNTPLALTPISAPRVAAGPT